MVSFNGGDRWQPLQQNLPIVPIHDLEVKDDDLVAATHGRSFWIMDDLSPLRQTAADPTGPSVRLFKPRTTHPGTPRPKLLACPLKPLGATNARVPSSSPTHSGPTMMTASFAATWTAARIRPSGVYVHYYLDDATEESCLHHLPGRLPASLSSAIRFQDDADAPSLALDEERGPKPRPGLNRLVWNMRYPKAQPLPGDPLTESLHPPAITGPTAPPGSYGVRLQVGDRTLTQSFEIVKDPRLDATQEEMQEQFSFLIRMRDKLTQTHAAVEQIRSVRKQVDEWAGRTNAQPVADAAKDLNEKLAAIEGELAQTKANAQIDRLKYPAKINGKINGLISWVTSSDERPTQQSREVFGLLSDQVNVQLDTLKTVLDEDVAKFNTLVAEMEVAALNPNP